jgi:hypothetical protein
MFAFPKSKQTVRVGRCQVGQDDKPHLLLSCLYKNLFRWVADSNANDGWNLSRDVLIDDPVKRALSFPSEFLISPILGRRDIEVHDVEKDDCDVRRVRKAVYHIEDLEWAAVHVNGQQDSLGFHNGRVSAPSQPCRLCLPDGDGFDTGCRGDWLLRVNLPSKADKAGGAEINKPTRRST